MVCYKLKLVIKNSETKGNNLCEQENYIFLKKSRVSLVDLSHSSLNIGANVPFLNCIIF